MPYLQHQDAHFPLAQGETRVGRGVGADVCVPPCAEPGDVADAALVAVVIAPDGAASLRVVQGDAGVFVNGVPVGREPAPLLHGDRVAIDGCELRFADEQQGGVTLEVPTQGDVRVATPSILSGRLRRDLLSEFLRELSPPRARERIGRMRCPGTAYVIDPLAKRARERLDGLPRLPDMGFRQ